MKYLVVVPYGDRRPAGRPVLLVWIHCTNRLLSVDARPANPTGVNFIYRVLSNAIDTVAVSEVVLNGAGTRAGQGCVHQLEVRRRTHVTGLVGGLETVELRTGVADVCAAADRDWSVTNEGGDVHHLVASIVIGQGVFIVGFAQDVLCYVGVVAVESSKDGHRHEVAERNEGRAEAKVLLVSVPGKSEWIGARGETGIPSFATAVEQDSRVSRIGFSKTSMAGPPASPRSPHFQGSI